MQLRILPTTNRLLQHPLILFSPASLDEQQKPRPDEIRITDPLPLKERALGLLLQQRRHLPDERLHLRKRPIVAAPRLDKLLERHVADPLGPCLMPVLRADGVEDDGGDSENEEVDERVGHARHDGLELGQRGRVEVQGGGGVPLLECVGDFAAVHYVGHLAVGLREADGGDGVEGVGGVGLDFALESGLDVGVFNLRLGLVSVSCDGELDGLLTHSVL